MEPFVILITGAKITFTGGDFERLRGLDAEMVIITERIEADGTITLNRPLERGELLSVMRREFPAKAGDDCIVASGRDWVSMNQAPRSPKRARGPRRGDAPTRSFR